jgi:membrane protein implicated in regulation of membrane protease activity
VSVLSVLSALAAGGTPAHGATFSWATIVIVVVIAVAAAPLVRHRRATAVAGRPARLREPAKIKRSDDYWRSRNLAHIAPQERVSQGLPPVHREEEWD